MLGMVSKKYLDKSKEQDKNVKAKNIGFGFSFGVTVESFEDMIALQEEEKLYTAEDLGYE